MSGLGEGYKREEDPELELITAKKMMELRRRLLRRQEASRQERGGQDPKEVVMAKLVARGDEVLRAAESLYPRETALVVKRLAELIEKGIIDQPITGGELLQIFQSLGLRVRIPTSITIEKKGRSISLAEKIRGEE